MLMERMSHSVYKQNKVKTQQRKEWKKKVC